MNLANWLKIAMEQTTFVGPLKNRAFEIPNIRGSCCEEAGGHLRGSVSDGTVEDYGTARGETGEEFFSIGIGIDAAGTGQVADGVFLQFADIEKEWRFAGRVSQQCGEFGSGDSGYLRELSRDFARGFDKLSLGRGAAFATSHEHDRGQQHYDFHGFPWRVGSRVASGVRNMPGTV